MTFGLFYSSSSISFKVYNVIVVLSILTSWRSVGMNYPVSEYISRRVISFVGTLPWKEIKDQRAEVHKLKEVYCGNFACPTIQSGCSVFLVLAPFVCGCIQKIGERNSWF